MQISLRCLLRNASDIIHIHIVLQCGSRRNWPHVCAAKDISKAFQNAIENLPHECSKPTHEKQLQLQLQALGCGVAKFLYGNRLVCRAAMCRLFSGEPPVQMPELPPHVQLSEEILTAYCECFDFRTPAIHRMDTNKTQDGISMQCHEEQTTEPLILECLRMFLSTVSLCVGVDVSDDVMQPSRPILTAFSKEFWRQIYGPERPPELDAAFSQGLIPEVSESLVIQFVSAIVQKHSEMFSGAENTIHFCSSAVRFARRERVVLSAHLCVMR